MFGGQSRDASRRCAFSELRHHLPGHADGQRPLVARGGAQVAQFVEAGVGAAATDPPRAAAQQGARRDAHRGPVGVVVGQPIGDLTGPPPTRLRRGDVAVGRPGSGAHVPAEGRAQIAGGLQMLGDQRRILVGRARIALFDRGGQAPVQLRAIGFELRLVGHRADQRVPKRVLGARGEPHLIDQLRLDQRCHVRAVDQAGQQIGVES